MAGTPLRPLTRFIDQSHAALWVISPVGRLSFLSSGVGDWLGIDPSELLDRQAIAGTAISNQWQDQLAAALSAPPGLAQRGTASLKISPPNLSQRSGSTTTTPDSIPTRDVRFIRVGEPEHAFTIAIAGRFHDQDTDHRWNEAVELRRRLDQWRKQVRAASVVVAAGGSPLARRLRNQIRVASLSRIDVLVFGKGGCGGETIAEGIHQSSAPGEPLVKVDGPLMDGELLDATISPLIGVLDQSPKALGSVLVRGLDRMPPGAQTRLAEVYGHYNQRLRLLAVTRDRRPLDERETPTTETETDTPQSSNDPTLDLSWSQNEPTGVIAKLIDVFCAMTIPVPPLTHRIEDIPLLATALLDAERASKMRGVPSRNQPHLDHTPDRFHRSALDAMAIYPWPGDFRELADTVGAAYRVATGNVVGVEHLPLAVRSYRVGAPQTHTKTMSVELDVEVRRFESKLIQAALEAADGNRAEAARRLCISRARLLRKLDEAKQADG